ncbi:MAG: transglutaminase-like domain-containing protein, partial [Acidobacteriota bacterium]
PEPPAGERFPVASTSKTREYIEPNAYIQSDDVGIQRLARELAGVEKDAFLAGIILERWVAEQMSFDLGIVFAPATEIFRDRRGTCVGYATILATLARAVGIPSRVAMGYVYALGMLGGHAWTEIRVGESWIPLDAAIVNAGAADATRLLLVSSSLAEGAGKLSLGAAQQLFGQVDIEVLEFETRGKTVSVPSGANPFIVSGDRYENPWLEIRFSKPSSYKFGRLDAVWPDRTLAELEGPGSEKAVLEQHEIYPWEDPRKAVSEKLARMIPGGKQETVTLDGKEVTLISASGSSPAAGAAVRGTEVLVWRVEGKNALQLLLQLIKTSEIDSHSYF